MGVDLNKLSPAALRAAMKDGTGAWGQHGSVTKHTRYAEPIHSRSRRRCSCGCGTRSTHTGRVSGMAMIDGCEMFIARWVRDPFCMLRKRAPSSDNTGE